MQVHPTNKNEVSWTSWMPALGHALGASTGPVLELGVGHFSTPFLHEYCKGAGRGLMTVESDPSWGAEFCVKYSSETHLFLLGGYEQIIPDLSDRDFGVVFIDNSPGGNARLEPFLAFLDHSEFIVVHDYHRENEEAIKPYLAGVNHKVYSDYDPPTLLASKTHIL